MTLKHEFQHALQAGVTSDALLQLVRRHQDHGLTPQESYDALQQLWLELEFDTRDEGDSWRDDLEYVMEKVWFQGSS